MLIVKIKLYFLKAYKKLILKIAGMALKTDVPDEK